MATYNPSNTGAGTGTGIGSETSGSAHGKGAGVTGAIGTGLEKAGDYLEDKGKAAFISDRLHNAGRYLQENDIRTISRSIDESITTHPYRSMLIGLGVGWFVGRFLSR